MYKIWDILTYWRNSLADSNRMDVGQGKLKNARIVEANIENGYLPQKVVIELFEEKKEVIKRYSQKPGEDEEIEINHVPVLISPMRVFQRFEHAKEKFASKKKTVYPLWVPANVTKSGELKPSSTLSPWIIRSVLEPVQESFKARFSDFTIGAVDNLDDFLTLHEVPLEHWNNYIKYCNDMFAHVSGTDLKEFSLDGYLVDYKLTVLLDSERGETNDGIIELYDNLREKKEIPVLLRQYASYGAPSLKHIIRENDYIRWSGEHVGQMGYEFSLLESQRQALYHYLTISESDILAVNGPPGTGKTTLLQSVAANAVVESALKGRNPFIMAVSSTNNQAIENIIESFGNARTRPGKLSGRWLPDINSFALFLPASTRDINKGIHYSRYNGEGLPNTIETPEYYNPARKAFLEKCGKYGGSVFTSVKTAVDFLQQRLKQTVGEIKKCSEYWVQLEKVKKEIAPYDEFGGANEYAEKLSTELTQHKNILNQIEEVKKEWLTEIRSESLLTKLLILLGFSSVKKKRETRYRMILSSWPEPVEHLDFSSRMKIEEFIANWIQNQKRQINEVKKNLDAAVALLKKLEDAENNWKDWKTRNNIECDPPETLRILDTTLRHDAFQLAVHYWEGRWLLEMNDFLRSDMKGKSRTKMEARWRRYAMITPCFVATFFMLPKFFKYSAWDEEKSLPCNLPLYEFIDLLMVEEAGQVTSEIGAASFSLAKKAIVVGDIYQIKPVRNITHRVDIGNMNRYKLIKNLVEEKKIKELHDIGVSAFKGNVMRVAQEKSFYKLPGLNDRGMFLSQHQRCFDEIIGYCNELAYKGKLIPLRGSPIQDELIFPAIGYANITSHSQVESGSRKNVTEAQVIVQWLKMNKKKIEDHYGAVEESVGIITPFALQRRELERALKKVNINSKTMKIGTIHALQGAERPIVIFSPVYGFDDNRDLWFINREINMLNVAVSRAKDSFLVFGNMCLFNPQERTPTGILSRYLFRDEANELADVCPPMRKEDKDVERISTIERHCRILKYALENAKSNVMIVSPFISINAIEHDKLPEIIKGAAARGIKVKVYTDLYLDKSGRGLKPWAEKGRQTLKESGAELIIVQGIHNKTLCVDNVYLAEGSFNWLSSPRERSNKYYRENVSFGYKGEKVAVFIRQAVSEMEYIAKMGARA